MARENSGTYLRCNPLLPLGLALTLVTCALDSLHADPALRLTVTDSTGLTSPPRVALTWDADGDGIYLVQSRTNLTTGTWMTEEPVKSNVGPIRWMAPEALEKSKFYQLVLPQPEIFGIEPAVMSTDGGTVYLMGQSLPNNGSARVGGLVLPPNVLKPGSVYSFSVPPLTEGTYDVEWLVGGQVVATAYKLFSVTGQPTPVGEARARLLEPPIEPPASPAMADKGVIGGDRNTGTGPNGQGLRSYSAGHFSLEVDGKKAAEGKKGLNAVNVKLASRIAGGGEDCDDTDAAFALWPHMHQTASRVKETGQWWTSKFKQTTTQDHVGEMRSSTKHPAKLEIPDMKMFSGEVQVETTDMVIPGRSLDFAWTRTYRSRTGTNTAMGNGWDFSYNISIQPIGGDILIHDGTGRADRFFLQTNGTYSAPEFFSEGAFTKGIFILTFPETGKWVFNPLDQSPQAGKIAQIVDRNGNQLTFSYDASGRLITVADDLGRPYSIGYDTNGFIHTLTDFSGSVVTFNHHGSSTSSNFRGQLLSVTSPPVVGTPNGNDFPDGKTTSYTYSTNSTDEALSNNLLSVTDGNGQTWLQFVYRTNTAPASLDYDAVDYVQRGPYRIKLRRFPQTPTPSNDFAVVKCIVNDGAGNVSECFYDSRNRCVRQLDYTGRANPDLPTTEVQNRPAGKLRQGDPASYETRYSWNSDSLCTRVTNPRGDATVMLYERDFDRNASPRKKGDLRVLRELACCTGADTDGDGGDDLMERAWHFTYDPRFGSPATCKGKKLFVGNLPFSATDASRFANGPRQTTSLDGTYSHRDMKLTSGQPTIIDNKKGLFITGIIDPRANTCVAQYDDQGNLIHCESADRKGGAIIACDFNYKEHGKLAAITNAPDGNGIRRVDTLNYYDSGPQTGYLADWTVDTQGPVVTITRFEYDPRGNLIRCVDPRANDWLFTYNALDQVVRCETPTNLTARCATDYFYDAADNLVQSMVEVRDDTDTKLGTVSRYQHFDTLRRCVRMEQERDSAHLVATEFNYDANDHLVLYRSPEAVNGNDPSNVVSYQYDERDLLFQETHGSGLTNGLLTECSYDGDGNLFTITLRDAFGNNNLPATCFYACDGFGRPVSVIDPMGNAVTRAFDSNDNLVYERLNGELNDLPGSTFNVRLSEKRYTYDGFDRCVHTSEAFFNPVTGLAIGDGSTDTTISYAPNGLVTNTADDNDHHTAYNYDRHHRLASITDPKTNLVTFTYDACGNLLSRQQVDGSDLGGPAQSFVTSFVYDALNRCISDSDNIGNTNLYFYDSRDNVMRFVDQNQNMALCRYDGLNRRTVAAADLDGDGLLDFAADAATAWTWDDNSRLVAETDDNTNTTHYAYDSLDRLVTTTHADQTEESLIWSPRSNVTLRTDANGTTTTSTYDLLDRCLQRNIAPGSGVAATTTFEQFQYDGLSRCVMASNNVSRLDFAYDSLGNCVTAGQDGLTTACTFDGMGNCLSMTYPGGRGVRYTYDALDRVNTLSSTRCEGCGNPWLGIETYAYDGPDRLAAISRTNGVNTRIRFNGLQGQVNSLGDRGWQQVSSINHARGAQVIDRRVFTYDGNQNKTLRAQTTPFAGNQPTTTNAWSYNALDQLSKAINTKGTGATVRSYHLDAKGNRLEVTNGVAVEVYLRDATLPEPADFQMDQYTVTPFGTEQHDHNGNLVHTDGSAGSTSYFYDYADRLVEVDRVANGISGPVVSFSYDALGRRIGKTSFPPAPAAPVTVQYVQAADMDCDGILEERSGGTVSRVYAWGHNNFAEANEDRVAFTGGGEPLYYHADELGNVLALTDANGSVLERYDYDDYGAPSFLTSDGLPAVGSDGLPATQSFLGNPYLFHGMTWEPEVALYHASGNSGENPLFESPNTGRYLSRGGDAGNLGYGDNNPWTAGKTGPTTKHQGDYLPVHNFKLEIDGVVGGGMLHLHKENIIHRDLAARSALQPTGPLSPDWTPSGAKLPRSVLKSYFETGDVPTESQLGKAINTKPLTGTANRLGKAINTKPLTGTANRNTVSNVLKTKHDTAKNSIGNIR